MFAYPYGKDKTHLIEKSLSVARAVACNHATRTPSIDGFLSEKAWRNPVSRLFRYNGAPAATESTSFYFSYDQAHLYLGARCMDSRPDSLFAVTRERDGAVYGEDCVGYFIQPAPDDGDVYQIYFSAMGTVFDQVFTTNAEGDVDVNRRWDCRCDVATRQTKEAWTIEIRIPVDQFGLMNETGQQWRLNFRRKQWRLGESADWQIPIGSDPADFGFLDFR
jgi:hypothetical protein